MTILQKLLLAFKLATSVGPKIIADVERAITKIKEDTKLIQRIHDALDAAINVLTDIGDLL